MNFDLPLGSITQTVEVTAEASLVNTVGGSLGNTIDSSRITELPLNGRDLAQLVTLQAGVVNYTGGDPEPGGGKLLVVSGARPTTNVFYMDGVAIESYNKKTPTGMSGNFLGADGVREFKVDSNAYSAEFGGGAGGVFNITTKGGTNTMHGTAFWALRNDNFDAAQWEDDAFGDEKPEFKRNQFGFSLGGPIRRDKTFFFGNYEALRERLGETAVGRTFSDSLRQGIVPPATVPVAIDSRITPYLAFWPRPNGEVFGDGTANYITQRTIPTDDSYYQGRVDHQFNDNNLAFLRYTYLTSEQRTPPIFPGEAGVLNTQGNHLVTLEDKQILSPSLLNSVRLGFSRTQPFNGLLDPRVVDPSLLFTPKFSFLGTLNPGSGLHTVGVAEATSDRHINSYQFVDDVVITKGRNTYKFGIAWSRNGFNVYFPSQPAGNYAFGNVGNFLRAIPNTFRGAIIDGFDDAYRTLKWNLIALYFQDELRLTSRLTLNPGLRYEFGTVPTEKWGRVGNFHGDLEFLLRAGMSDITLGNPWIKNPTLKNFAPRIGLGWDVFGDGTTALRTGFGLFFVQLDQSWFRTMLWRMPPFLVDLQASGANVPFPNIYSLCGRENPTRPSNPVCTGRPAPQFPPYKTRSPYMMQYNLTLQRQFGSSMVATAGYSGSRGVRLNALANVNVPYGQSINGRLVFPAPPAPQSQLRQYAVPGTHGGFFLQFPASQRGQTDEPGSAVHRFLYVFQND
ncbi:MAG: TonB-dependent receptor [Acidobacteria bacterium]|nr:TonB-dependent receptor [Acidobacteriota bacterium]